MHSGPTVRHGIAGFMATQASRLTERQAANGSVCVGAQNHRCKLTHPAWVQMATSPSSHGTVEELSPLES